MVEVRIQREVQPSEALLIAEKTCLPVYMLSVHDRTAFLPHHQDGTSSEHQLRTSRLAYFVQRPSKSF